MVWYQRRFLKEVAYEKTSSCFAKNRERPSIGRACAGAFPGCGVCAGRRCARRGSRCSTNPDPPPVSSELVAPQSALAPAAAQAASGQAAAQAVSERVAAQAAAFAAEPAAPAVAAPTDAAALTPGWTQAGTCEWMIDAAGKLTVRPLGNGTSGNLGANPAGNTQSAPWREQRDSITSVVIEPGVSTTWANYMFYYCTNLVTADLSGLDASNATNFISMFDGCQKLETIDLGGLQTSKATYMSFMFKHCWALKELDLSSFDTTNVIYMSEMFYSCKSIKSLDLTSFDTKKVQLMQGFFQGCESLESVDLSTFTITRSTSTAHFFRDCPSLERLVLAAGIDLVGCVMYEHAWIDTAGNAYADSNEMFVANAARPSGVETFVYPQTTEGWTLSGSCEWMIDGTKTLIFRPVPGVPRGTLEAWSWKETCPWDYGASWVTSVRIEPGVSTVTCDYMFWKFRKLASVDLSGLDTSRVTSAYRMFFNCKSLETVDFSPLDTSGVTNMREMFAGCASLLAVDLSGFDFSQVTDASMMFGNCGKLRKVYVAEGFPGIPAAAASENMFQGCAALSGGAGTAFDAAHVDAAYARLDGGAADPGYFALGRGDVNCNGLLNIVDVQVAYDIANGGHAERHDLVWMRSRADVSGPAGAPDGAVDAQDAFAIQRAALLGWGEAI